MSSNDTAPSLLDTWKFGLRLSFYCFFLPVCMFFGILSNILTVIILRRKARETPCFLYQLWVAGYDLAAMILYVVYSVGKIFLYDREPSTAQYRSTYGVMFFATYIMAPAPNFVVFSGLVYFIGVTIDRVYSLYRPVVYAGLKHKPRVVKLLVLSLVIGFFNCFYDVFRKEVGWDPTQQAFMVDKRWDFIRSTLGRIGTVQQTLGKFGAIAALLIAFVVMARKYRKVMEHRRKTLFQGRELEKENQPIHESVLTQLLLVQSTVILVGYIPAILLFLCIYFRLLVPFVRLLVTVVDIAVVVMLFGKSLVYAGKSREFRQDVRAFLGLKPPPTAPEPSAEDARRRAW